MKKVLIAVMVMVIMVVGCTGTAFAKTANTRTAQGKVVGVYACDDCEYYYEVEFRTNDGNYWRYITDSTLFYPYQRVKIRFNTQGTKTKKDDAIKSIQLIQ